MIEQIYCPECDLFLDIELAPFTKFANRTAKQDHAESVHNGDMSVYRISVDKPMTSGELKHLREWEESRNKGLNI